MTRPESEFTQCNGRISLPFFFFKDLPSFLVCEKNQYFLLLSLEVHKIVWLYVHLILSPLLPASFSLFRSVRVHHFKTQAFNFIIRVRWQAFHPRCFLSNFLLVFVCNFLHPIGLSRASGLQNRGLE